jgi:hypothetical protein
MALSGVAAGAVDWFADRVLDGFELFVSGVDWVLGDRR